MTPCLNRFKGLCLLVLCSLSLFFSANSAAQYWTWSSLGGPSPPTAPSPDAACAATVAFGGYVSYRNVVVVAPPQASTCQIERKPAAGGGFFTYQLLPYNNAGDCPSGTVANSSAGYTVCVVPPPCPAAGAVTLPTALDGGFFVAMQQSPPNVGPSGTSFCMPFGQAQCEVKCPSGFSAPNPIASGYVAVCTSAKSTGAHCPSSGFPPLEVSLDNPLEVQPETGAGTEPSGPGDCPPGTGFAQINNKSSCLPSGTVGTGGSSSSSGSSGATTSSESDWKINGDGTTTMTTNSTTTSNGQTTSGSTTSTSGVNGAPGADRKDGKDFDPGPAPSWSDPGNGGNVPDASVGTLDSINWHQTFLPESGSCALADIPFEAMGQSFNFPMSALCPYLPILRGIIIFISVVFSIRLFAMAPW